MMQAMMIQRNQYMIDIILGIVYSFDMFMCSDDSMPNKLIKKLIVESNEIRDILDYCSFDTLGTFDLDNTLITPSHTKGLGSDKWFSMLLTHAFTVIPDRDLARKLTVELSDYVLDIIKFKPVEDRTAKILKLLSDVGLPIMGLTARHVKSSEMTERQLQSAGISFSQPGNEVDLLLKKSSNLGVKSVKLHGEVVTLSKSIDGVVELDIGDPTRKPCYKNGILYCDGADKGKCLAAFLAYLGVQYSVVMADDAKHNLECILKEAVAEEFSFIGLRYGRTDKLVEQFSMPAAMEKMKENMHLLPLKAQELIKELKLDFAVPAKPAGG